MEAENQKLGEPIFQDIAETDREQALEANCLRPETQTIRQHFEPDELLQMRKQFMDNSIIIRRAIEALNKAKEEYKEAVKLPEKDNSYLLNSIRCGFVEVEAQVYLFDDQEKGFMYTYDRRGQVYESRRLAPEERQLRVK